VTARVEGEIAFSRDGLSHLLTDFVRAGYSTVRFDEVRTDDAHLVLRHDVDFDLRFAVRVGEVEAQLDLRSTFFIMVRSECYSILDGAAKEHLDRLAEQGHGIGLHLDASLYAPDELAEGAREELRILEWISGRPVEAISFHRPAPHLVGSDRGAMPVPHTYEPRFTKDVHYVSDSQGRFRFGTPFESPAFHERRAIQLLLHPIWWAGMVPEDAEQRLRALVADRSHAFASRVARNCAPYRDMIR
jgi:hypothetical protein